MISKSSYDHVPPLHDAYPPYVKQKLLVIALAVVLVPGLLWALGLVGVTMALRSEIARNRERLLTEAALTTPLIASSKALLRDEPLLADAPADGADAAPVLDPLLHWSDEPEAQRRVRPPKLDAQFKKWDVDWAPHADELDLDEEGARPRLHGRPRAL